MRPWPPLAGLLLASAVAAAEADGRLGAALKSGLIVSKPSQAQAAAGATASGSTLWRLRLEPEGGLGEGLRAGAAYEQRLRLASAAGAVLIQGLAPEAGPALRLASLDGEIASGPDLDWRHELDRAWLALQGGWGGLTLGRQAVGWGRGQVFSPADLIAPSSPLEGDREWRRGVDAARLQVDAGRGVSAEALAAPGPPEAGRGAWLGRLRAAQGNADGELLGGRLFGDSLAGGGLAAALAGAELHAEAVVHFLEEDWGGERPWGMARVIPRAMLGLSRSWSVAGRSLYASAEGFDNGFGTAVAGDLPRRLGDPAFVERLRRGQLAVPGRHALAALASLELDPERSFSLAWVLDPGDGSGLLDGGLRWDLEGGLSLLAHLYLPYGPGDESGRPRSHFGGSPLSGLLQLKFYR